MAAKKQTALKRIRITLIGDLQNVVSRKTKIPQSKLSKLESGAIEPRESDYRKYLKAYAWLSPVEFFADK